MIEENSNDLLIEEKNKIIQEFENKIIFLKNEIDLKDSTIDELKKDIKRYNQEIFNSESLLEKNKEENEDYRRLFIVNKIL